MNRTSAGDSNRHPFVDGHPPSPGESRGFSPDPGDAAQETLRRELAPLKMGALQRRALEAGADPGAVDAALDAEDGRAALTALILHPAGAPPPVESAEATGGEDGGGGDDEDEEVGEWFPVGAVFVAANRSAVLIGELSEGVAVRVAGVASLRNAIEGHRVDGQQAFEWKEEDAKWAGLIGVVLEIDSENGIVRVDTAEKSNGSGEAVEAAVGYVPAAAVAEVRGGVGGQSDGGGGEADLSEGAVRAREVDRQLRLAESQELHMRLQRHQHMQGGGAHALREELQGLKLMALYARGSNAGVAAAVLEDAMDSEEPKAALIELIVNQPVFSEQHEQEHEQQRRRLQEDQLQEQQQAAHVEMEQNREQQRQRLLQQTQDDNDGDEEDVQPQSLPAAPAPAGGLMFPPQASPSRR